MHIGLIGGIGPAATDFYYQCLIKRAKAAGNDMNLTMVHADAPTLLGNLAKEDHAAQIAIYQGLTERLARPGADCVVVTSIAGHFCVDGFKDISPLPVVDMMGALRDHLSASGMKTVGVLGTRTVMATGMYGKLAPVEVLAPAAEGLDAVHDAYVDLATSGTPTDAHRACFFDAGKALVDRGAEAVLLGGTDLNVAFAGHDPGFPLVDCADIHVDDIATRL